MPKLNSLRIGVIGTKGHASEHIKYLKENQLVSEILTYHYQKNKADSNDLDDLLTMDGIIISSPTSTHINLLKYFQEAQFSKYIYLEKPGFEDHKGAKLIENYFKVNPRILIGYHIPYTNIYKRLKEELFRSEQEIILSVDIINSTGIAYKDWFCDSWRSKNYMQISLTGMCHILSIFNMIDPNKVKREVYVRHKNQKGFYDTCFTHYISNGITFRGVYTWGAPALSELKIITSENIYVLKNGHLSIYGPRDTFDEQGLFTTPNVKLSFVDNDLSIRNSQNNFIDQISNQRIYSISDLLESIQIGSECIDSKLLEETYNHKR